MNNDLISRNALMELARNHIGRTVDCNDIARVPAVDAEPVRHGRWIEYENESDKGFHYCSECKRQAFNYEDFYDIYEALTNYCPDCGAKMDGGVTDGCNPSE